MEENNNNNTPTTMVFKSHIVLPFMSIFTLGVAICFLVVDDFTVELNKFIVWFYFAINLIYIGISIFDINVNKEKSNKQKMFVAIMCVIDFIATILYAVFFLIAK